MDDWSIDADAILYSGAFLTLIGEVVLLRFMVKKNRSTAFCNGSWVAAFLTAGAMTWLITGAWTEWLLLSGAAAAFALFAAAIMPRLTVFGAGLLAGRFYLPLCGMLLLHAGARGNSWSAAPGFGYYLIQAALLIVAVIGTLFIALSSLAPFCLRYPKRDRAREKMAALSGKFTPKVSVHLPCYAEPPHLVMATLNAIANFNYQHFEVLVIDNNTKDPDLWRPVEAHCARLGPRFRFFHVDPLSGAKAGALNFALTQTADDAEIIAVIDADYLAKADFLQQLVPLFAAAETGFVQTSHDYRQWETSRVLSGAYYEYLPLHKLMLPALNEYDAAYTVGTMCLIRRAALQKAGGWAEWALTEDSELAVRINAQGYIGHVFADTWGKGLIPGTLEGIKKQQFRWTAGPVQQLKKHWRLYLGLSEDGRLSFPQKVLELRHSFDRLPTALSFFIAFPSLFLCGLSIWRQSVAAVPHSLIALILAGVIAACIDRCMQMKLMGAAGWRDYVYGLLVGEALKWTYIKGFFSPFFNREMAWHRTDKFSKAQNFIRAFTSAKTETCWALAYFAIAAGLLCFTPFQRFDYVALTALLFAAQGAGFLCTLLVALLMEAELAQSEKPPYAGD
ncbi:glycosyltransferase [Brenneria tiliae]|uniref:glycosyltransferase n=1 Tax=Brenneria tiliae TaxID=2914984 RepID=UPI002014FA0E|nr:glycosyltransferase [Brenneria tiliae]MCL2898431.1 glycosyltransferase [Brenneria tiliae]MCL2903027.1 glycosyltransferase [Brenneria tiliae]